MAIRTHCVYLRRTDRQRQLEQTRMSGVRSDSCMPYSSQLALVSGLPPPSSSSDLQTAHRCVVLPSTNTAISFDGYSNALLITNTLAALHDLYTYSKYILPAVLLSSVLFSPLSAAASSDGPPGVPSADEAGLTLPDVECCILGLFDDLAASSSIFILSLK